MRKKRLKHRELLKRLKKFGVIEDKSRGKGSECILFIDRGFKGIIQGPQTPIKYRGENTEYSIKVIDSIIRTFDIDPDEFWSN